jgi:putative DNA primase/helicase
MSMLEAVLHYAEHGLPVFPCNPKTKAPLVKGGFHSATTDEALIRGWWSQWPTAMVGMPTGVKSGIDVLDLDVDASKGKDGLAQVPNWQALSSVIVRTPRGGAHIWFKADGSISNTTDRIAFGVDTRGNGGYVILPPSENGAAAYRFEKGNVQSIPSLPPFPAELLTRLYDEKSDRTPGREPEADIELIDAALAVISNSDLGWEEWNRIGMAAWRASKGEAFTAFETWSKKSEKYNARTTSEKWSQYFKAPPTRIGIGTLFHLANKASPGWDAAYQRKVEDRVNTRSDAATTKRQIEWLKKNVWPENTASHKEERASAEPEPDTTNNIKSDEKTSTSAEPGTADNKKSDQKTNSGLTIVRVADVEAKKVDWLWPGRIARGKLTIIAGMPDVNKSTLTLDLTARVTTGGLLPCGEGHMPLGSVIILTAEDDVADTVRPRLEVAGANLTRVHVITASKATDGKGLRSFDLSQDIARLELATQEIGDVALVVIDPISAYMGKPGKLDSYRSTDVRATLAPLQEAAARCGAAVVGIDHLNKSGAAQAMMRVLGSVAFVAAARAVYVVVRDEEDDARRLMLPAKNNLGKMRTGLAFRVFEKLATSIFDAYPTIKWEDEPVTMTADEALANKQDGRKSETAELAKRLIAEALAERSVPAKEIEELAGAKNISHRSLDTAKKAMGVVSSKIGTAWWWSLPGRDKPI